ncbi:50S ribosomal protein L4 [Patescibacteria group bacterium]|nr:50S ribosomal protein L4 [Patescibacteria group bacterium]
MPVKKSKIPVKKSKVVTKRKEAIGKVVAKKSAPRVLGLSADVYDAEGKVVSKIDLPKEIFGAKINNRLMAQAVRVYLANQRKGRASVKTRGEVKGSTKKIWKQKGTGRARHGSKKAPIFVGGGVAFGPTPRDFSLKFTKKMKKTSLFSALSYKQKAGEIKVVTGFEKIEPKTKIMAKALGNLELNKNKRNSLLVMPGLSKSGFENLYRASRNLEDLDILNADLLNTYEVLKAKTIILMKDSLEVMRNTFVKEEK